MPVCRQIDFLLRHTCSTLFLFSLLIDFSGKKPKAKSRAHRSNKKTRPENNPPMADYPRLRKGIMDTVTV
jgi:hypothetical protein